MCCNEACKCGDCAKKCIKPLLFILSSACISFVVSMIVVKAFAPCVVKKAMQKKFIEKQMDMYMMKAMMGGEKMMKKQPMIGNMKGPKGNKMADKK